MMQIRSPYASEMNDLAGLDHSIYGVQSYSSLTLRQFMDVAGPLLAVAVDDSGILGYSLVLPSAVSGEGWFIALGIRVDRRREGVGRTLAVSAMGSAVEHGLHVLRLTVAPANLAALSLYKGLGFTIESRVDGYFGADEDRIILRRSSGALDIPSPARTRYPVHAEHQRDADPVPT